MRIKFPSKLNSRIFFILGWFLFEYQSQNALAENALLSAELALARELNELCRSRVIFESNGAPNDFRSTVESAIDGGRIFSDRGNMIYVETPNGTYYKIRVRDQGPVRHMQFMAEIQDDALPARLRPPKRNPLESDSLVFDSQLAITLTSLQRPGQNIPSRQLSLAQQIRRRHLDRVNAPYITDRTTTELLYDGLAYQQRLPHGARRILIRLPEGRSRENSLEYQAIMNSLERARVGGSRGSDDRQIVADLFFAVRNSPESIPTFVTADSGIFRRLCTLSTECHSPNSESPFSVTIRGRTIRVLPILQ